MPKRRTQSPPILPITDIHYPAYTQGNLSRSGIPLTDIRLGEQDILRIDVIVNAGRRHEQVPLSARAVAALLREGTQGHSAHEIAEILDFHGATLRTMDSFDFSSFSLYTQPRHAERLLPLMAELLSKPLFAEDELRHYTSRMKQFLMVDMEKVDIMAYRLFTESLFGAQHPYGYNSTPELYENLRSEQLQAFFTARYTRPQFRILCAGKTSDALIDHIDNCFADISTHTGTESSVLPDIHSSSQKHILIDKPKSAQSAIMYGRLVPQRSHPDTFSLYMLNAVLGGYFGSRLMSNLREDKGLTYGVYSSIDHYQDASLWYVSTEVNKEYREEALDEIRKEMQILCDELLDEEELEMVKNYLLGQFLRALDGAMSTADVLKNMLIGAYDYSYLQAMTEAIRCCDAETIRQTARQYMNPADFTSVVYG